MQRNNMLIWLPVCDSDLCQHCWLSSGPSVSSGRQGADLSVICQCIEVAKTRHKEVSQLIAQQLEALQ